MPARKINPMSHQKQCLIRISRTQRVLITTRTQTSHLNITNSVRQSPVMISTSHLNITNSNDSSENHELNEWCTFHSTNSMSFPHITNSTNHLNITHSNESCIYHELKVRIVYTWMRQSSRQFDEYCTYSAFNKSFEHHELKRVIWKPRTQWVIYILRIQWSCTYFEFNKSSEHRFNESYLNITNQCV